MVAEVVVVLVYPLVSGVVELGSKLATEVINLVVSELSVLEVVGLVKKLVVAEVVDSKIQIGVSTCGTWIRIGDRSGDGGCHV